METKECLICDRIALIRAGKNPHFVAETETGFVVLGDQQLFHGYTLLLCKEHKQELHQLEPDFRKILVGNERSRGRLYLLLSRLASLITNYWAIPTIICIAYFSAPY